MFTKISCLVIALIILVSCSDDSTNPNDKDPVDQSIYSISGTIKCDENYVIPASARVLVMWIVTWNGPDYGYFWTEGTLDRTKKTFKVAFEKNPPDSCFNNAESLKLGVAYIVLVDGFTGSEGELSESVFNSIIGAVEDRALIYCNGNMNILESRFFNFKQGYNFGKGWYNPEQGFDGWESIETTNIELKIGSFREFIFPNWT